MKKIYLILSVLILTQCKIQISNHDFYYHGTDSINTSKNFRYIKHNVTGKSSTTYDLKQKVRNGTTYGDVETGLIADAKLDLYLSHELKDNQAFANLSIDISKTRDAFDYKWVRVIVLDVVISADIIEYY